MQQSKRKNSLLYLLLILFAFNSCSLEKRTENKQRKAERKIEKLTIKYPQLLKQSDIRTKGAIRNPYDNLARELIIIQKKHR